MTGNTNRRIKVTIGSWAAAVGLLGATVSEAMPVTYTDEATYIAGAGTQSIEGFESALATNTFAFGSSVTLPDLTVALANGGTLGLAGGGVRSSPFGHTHATDGTNYFINSTSGGGLKGLTITFNGPVTEFGINIAGLDEYGANLDYETNGGQSGTAGLGSGSADQFFGLIDTASPFSVIWFTTNDVSIQYGIDEIYYSPVGAIPEPATLALLSFALASLGLCRHGRT